MTEYLIKKLQTNELAYVEDRPGERGGQAFFITEQGRRLFPTLSTEVRNDTAILNIVTHDSDELHQAKYVYHNDRHFDGTRNETRLYLNQHINPNQNLFLRDDVVVLYKMTFLNEENQDESAYVITRYREGTDHNDCLLLAAIIDNPEYSLRGGSAAIVTEDELQGLEHYRDRVFRYELEDGAEPVIDQELAVAYLADATAADAEREDDDRDDQEKQIKRLICHLYNWKCAITHTGFKWTEPQGTRYGFLEGAHVKPRAHDGGYRPDNILPMRRDIHVLFDRGLFGITDEDIIEVHPEARRMPGMDDLFPYHDQQILTPAGCRISNTNKTWHRQHVFGLFTRGDQIRRR